MLFASARNFASQVVWDPEGGNQHDPENLQFLAQIPQHLLPLIGTMRVRGDSAPLEAAPAWPGHRDSAITARPVHGRSQVTKLSLRQ